MNITRVIDRIANEDACMNNAAIQLLVGSLLVAKDEDLEPVELLSRGEWVEVKVFRVEGRHLVIPGMFCSCPRYGGDERTCEHLVAVAMTKQKETKVADGEFRDFVTETFQSLRG